MDIGGLPQGSVYACGVCSRAPNMYEAPNNQLSHICDFWWFFQSFRIGPNLHKMCILGSLCLVINLDDFDLHLQGHLGEK